MSQDSWQITRADTVHTGRSPHVAGNAILRVDPAAYRTIVHRFSGRACCQQQSQQQPSQPKHQSPPDPAAPSDAWPSRIAGAARSARNGCSCARATPSACTSCSGSSDDLRNESVEHHQQQDQHKDDPCRNPDSDAVSIVLHHRSPHISRFSSSSVSCRHSSWQSQSAG